MYVPFSFWFRNKLMELETSRLIIKPLTVKQFKLLLESFGKMEQALGLMSSGEVWTEDVQEAMEVLYKEALKNPIDWIWYTNWQIILKSENKAIGSLCFMRAPDEKGVVEIGYGIHEKYHNKGYMTEALQVVCGWALNQDGVKAVAAETEKDNIASQQVLQKSGFKVLEEREQSLLWNLL